MQILHTKLTTKTEVGSDQIKSAVLYDGSITTFDSRLYGFDIGTCLEVFFLSQYFVDAFAEMSSPV